MFKLSLLLCYAYVFLKALSVTVHFLGLITFGFRCLSQKFYIETAVFFIFHLPLQIFGSKRAKNFGVSLKRAKQEKLAMIIAAGVATSNHEVSTAGVRPVKKKKSGYHLSRRPSYHVVTTVDWYQDLKYFLTKLSFNNVAALLQLMTLFVTVLSVFKVLKNYNYCFKIINKLSMHTMQKKSSHIIKGENFQKKISR